jgi:hypothetical protein
MAQGFRSAAGVSSFCGINEGTKLRDDIFGESLSIALPEVSSARRSTETLSEVLGMKER